MDIAKKTLTPLESKEYFTNMWNKKYGLGLCYSAMHTLQEHILITYQINSKKYYLLHALYDGISSLQFFNQKFQLGLKIQKLHAQKAPKFLKKLIALAVAFQSLRMKSLKLKTPLSKTTINSDFQIQLNPKETQELLKKIKNHKLSTTSFFLNTFSNIFNKKCLEDNSTANWMVPVNMRGEEDINKRMYSSYIAQEVAASETYKKTHQNLKSLLSKNQHWGLLYLAKLSLLLGRSILIKETKKELSRAKPKWLGSLSNLGDLGESSSTIRIIPPVRFHRPIGIVCFIVNKKIHIDFNLYQGIIKNINLEQLKNELRKSITRN